MHEATFSHAGHRVAVVFSRSGAAVNNTKMEFTVFDGRGVYRGGMRLRYTNFGLSEDLDEWVFNVGRKEIERRLDVHEPFAMIMEDYPVDPAIMPRS